MKPVCLICAELIFPSKKLFSKYCHILRKILLLAAEKTNTNNKKYGT